MSILIKWTLILDAPWPLGKGDTVINKITHPPILIYSMIPSAKTLLKMANLLGLAEQSAWITELKFFMVTLSWGDSFDVAERL